MLDATYLQYWNSFSTKQDIVFQNNQEDTIHENSFFEEFLGSNRIMNFSKPLVFCHRFIS